MDRITLKNIDVDHEKNLVCCRIDFKAISNNVKENYDKLTDILSEKIKPESIVMISINPSPTNVKECFIYLDKYAYTSFEDIKGRFL